MLACICGYEQANPDEETCPGCHRELTEELDRLARASGVLEPLQDTCPSCGQRAEIETYEHPRTKEVLYTWKNCQHCGERFLIYVAPGAYEPEYEQLGSSVPSGAESPGRAEPEAEQLPSSRPARR